MIYRDFKGEKLSALGLGTMRMPVVNGKEESINEAKAREMVDFAMKNGINYYDTAWMYHGGNSERMIGKILADYPRGSFNLATKFPGNIRENIGRVEEIFEEQLRRCRVDYFDFYLFHNVCEINVDNYMDPQYGVMEYLLKQKKEGRIRHLGFSTHGRVDVMRRFMDAYGKDMEFCQIQLNYLDYKFQHAKEKVELIKQYGLPVWVMEPLRGGKLATVDDKYAAELTALRPDESVPGWGFRFLQSIPEVTMVLSGMSNLQQLADNIRIFSEDKPLDSHELTALTGVVDKMISEIALPCTGCRYCTAKCPKGLDIPMLIEHYNEHVYSQGGLRAPLWLASIPADKQPSACIGCRSCEQVCPQEIKISETMRDFVERLKVVKEGAAYGVKPIEDKRA